MATATFQQGIDGYSAAYDTMLRESKPQNDYHTAVNVNVDGVDSAAKKNQGLFSSTICSATARARSRSAPRSPRPR